MSFPRMSIATNSSGALAGNSFRKFLCCLVEILFFGNDTQFRGAAYISTAMEGQ